MDHIEYREVSHPRMNDQFSDILRESADYFASKGIQMTNPQGFQEILSDGTLFESYKSNLCEGMEADQIENFNQLMDNSRKQILQEATVDGIQQIAGLSMPTIRKMWAKVALKHAMPTQVVSTPRFAISYTKAYLMDAEGNRYELPNAINDIHNKRAQLPQASEEPIDITGGLEDYDLFQLFDVSLSAAKNDSIDKIFYVNDVIVDAPVLPADDPQNDTGAEITGEKVTVRVHIKTDQYAMIQGKVAIPVKKTDPDTGAVTEYGTIYDTLFGKVDYSEGTMTLLSTKGIINAVTILAKASQETNEQGESVSFDVLTKDITIGVGTHLNAPLPIEWLQDTMAIYNIDGAAEVVDIMSQTVAQKLELEIYNFLVNSIDNNNVPYIGEFNIIPSAGYNGRPKDWREELKTVIDYYAIKMKTDSKFHGGKFMIIGNPIDMQLLPNVDWVFNHTSDQMSGVDVSFNLGAFSGANRYEMVSSDLVPDGAFIMFFVPGIDRLMTYKYYPYTFNVERGYRDPNMPNVPSIMMTKRHTIEEFTPLICRIDILNNYGKVPATPGY
jgi:hypothetical protein